MNLTINISKNSTSKNNGNYKYFGLRSILKVYISVVSIIYPEIKFV